jgi:ribosomal protein S18 acetylase RimI-like enzyme
MGIGKALCLEFLKECEKATVWTGQDNIPAIGLYKSTGFELTQTVSTIYEKE